MNKFRVNDIITGIKGEHYGITTEDALLKVVKCMQTRRDGEYLRVYDLEVKLIGHTAFPKHVGAVYHVHSKYFKLIPKIKAELLK